MALNVNTSIVDYLKSVGQPSDFGSRTSLASRYGIQNYAGTAAQNTQLLNLVRAGSQPAPSAPSAPAPSSPTPSAPASTPTPRTDYVADLFAKTQERDAQEKAKVDAARTALINYYAGLEPISDRYSRLSTEQGLPQQQELVNQLAGRALETEDLIEGIEPSVKQRSGDFLITEADRVAITAKEQQPLLKELNKILRQKEREEIGLTGKMNLVKELIAYSIEDDKQRARPYELGVDFTTDDRDTAMDLLTDLFSASTSAFSADISDAESRAEAERTRQFQSSEAEKDRAFELKLEQIQQANKKSTSKSDQKTKDVWNSIVAGAKTEYDVWKEINSKQDALRAAGVDVDELWSLHKALAAKVGKGGSIRSSSGGGDLDDL